MAGRILLACVFALALLTPLSVTAQVDDDEFEPTPLPFLPNATFGQRNIAVQITSDAIFDEPLFMYFQVFGFASNSEAKSALGPIYDHYFEVEQAELDISAWYDFRGVSVGRLGDDRMAFATEGKDIVMGSTAKHVHVFVQLGPNVLYLQSMSLGGKTLEFIAEYLEEFLLDATDDPVSLLPTLSTLPVGWQLPAVPPEDFLFQLTHEPTPTPVPPTPTPKPTVPPTPTPVPLTAKVLFTLAPGVVEDLDGNSCQGKDGYYFLHEGQTVDVATAKRSGKVLDTLTLGTGALLEDGSCSWAATVTVNPDAEFLSLYFFSNDFLLGVVGPRLFRSDESPIVIEVRLADKPGLAPTAPPHTTPTSTELPETTPPAESIHATPPISPTETAIEGNITVRIGGVYLEEIPGGCQATGFWDDVQVGAPIRLLDGADKVIWEGMLTEGSIVQKDICEWVIPVSLPGHMAFSVKIGSKTWGPYVTPEIQQGIIIEEYKAGR